MKKYEKYKESNNIEIKEIPQNWKIIKIKNPDFFEIQSSGIDEFEGTKEYLSTESILETELDHVEETITFKKRPARANLQPKKGNIYFAKMKETHKMILPDNYFCEKYIISTGFAGLVSKKINSSFIKYVILSHYFNSKKDVFSQGTTQEAINNRWIREISIPEPPVEEQLAIVKFLDEKTEKIDKTIKNKKRQIEVIEQLHKIKINNIFSNGLSINNELTPDIGWTRNLPKKYKVIKLKKCLKKSLSNGLFKKKRFFGSGTLLVNVFDIYSSIFIDTQKLERVQATNEEIDNYSIIENDIFMTRSSLKLEGIAMCAMANKLDEPVVYECHIIKISPEESIIDPKYLAFYLRYFANDMLISLSNTVTMTTISQPKINNIRVILPPLDIQKEKIKEIVNIYLNQINLTRTLKEQIQKLEEYKKILINEAVTGKIKVTA